MDSEWKITGAVRCGKGRIRGNNEDAFYLDGSYRPLEEMSLETAWHLTVDGNGSLWSVCDGVGGESNGERASNLAVSGMEELQEHLKGRDFAAVLQNWVAQANRAILRDADGGACTMVLLYGQENRICYAHIGDSRIYRVHEGELVRLTRDHSKVEMLMAAGLITKEEAAVHPQRHVITRSLGTGDDILLTATVGNPLPVSDGDLYILCSDGLTDMLTDEEIGRIVRKSDTAEDCADDLYRAALKAGGRDNLTVMALKLSRPGSRNGEEDEDEEEDEPTLEREPAGAGAKEDLRLRVDIRRQERAGGPFEVVINHQMGGRNKQIRVSL